MLLNSITTLSSYPFEKIQINLDNTVAPQLNARFGIRFRDNFWTDNGNILNFDQNLTLNQAGIDPLVISSPTLSSQFNLNQNLKFVQPTNLITIPSDFPTFFSLSAIPLNNLLLTFRGGVSAISIFPSRPYPFISKINNNSFSVSGVFAQLYSENREITNSQYHQANKTISNLEAKNSTLSMTISSGNSINFFPDIFKSAHKHNFLFATPTNPVFDVAFHNASLPDQNIIPETFFIQMTLSSANTIIPYRMCFSEFLNSDYATLSSIALLNTVAPIISANVSRSGLLNIKIHPLFVLPKDENVLISYETSAFPFSVSPFVQATTACNTNINNFTVSSEDSAYLFNYKFKLNNVLGISDAFNINFAPSAFFIANPTFSSVSISSVMVDNYGQSVFPIRNNDIKVKFFDNIIGTSRLSAIDQGSSITYIENEWMPASAKILLVNDGTVSSNTLTLSYSAVNNSIWDFPLPTFPINSDKSQIFLSLSQSTELSAKINANIIPNYNPSSLVKWSVHPNDNIVISDNSGNIPLDTFVQAGSLEINVFNLGIEPTTVTLFYQDYGVSSSVIWFPPANSLSAASFILSASPINDFNLTKFSSVSALFVKNGRFYKCPVTNAITWSETKNDPRGTATFFADTSSILAENAAYPSSTNNTIVDVQFTTNTTVQLPQNVSFSLNAVYFNDTFSFSNTLLLAAREYPAISPLNAIVNTSGASFNTISAESWVYTANQSVSAYINTSSFSNYSPNNFRWQTPTGIVTGISATFPLSSNYTLSFTAISARPVVGSFGFYNFIDSVDLYVLDPSNVLNFIAFPEIRYLPPLTLTTANYTESVGLTAFNTCKNQFIVLSANKQFDEYRYSIGSKTLSSRENPFSFPVNATDVLSSGVIQITGFNEIFSKNQPFTTLNYVSSDNSSKYKQHVSFVQIPSISSTISVQKNILNVQSSPFINIDTTFSNDFPIIDGTYKFVLSAANFIKYSNNYPQTTLSVSEQFTNNLSDFFSISADTFNRLNLFSIATLSGQTQDNCIFVQNISSNVISITAYDGDNPRLNVFTNKHIIPSNTLISFKNVTTNLLPLAPTAYMFDNGTGIIQYSSAISTPFSGFYTTEGAYNVSMSATVNGETIEQTWNNFIIVKNTFDEYIPAFIRAFDKPLELPFACDSLINPNSWQFAKTLNDTFFKLKTNFEYLSANGTAYNINLPKYTIGYWGRSSTGLEQWCYDNSIPLASSLINIKDGIKIDNDLFIINNNTIEIRNFDFNLSKIKTITNITETEKFISPSNIVFNNLLQKIIVLDREQKLVYVFDKQTFKLANYWGGEGDKTSKTRFLDPCDLSIDSDNNLFITDKSQKTVKIYNSTLNWSASLTHIDWNSDAPVSCFSYINTVYVLTENGVVFIFKNSSFVDKFTANKGTKIYVFENIIYILGEKTTCYGINGSFINSFKQNQSHDKMIFENKEIYAISSNAIWKYVEYLEYFKIISYDKTVNNMWSWDTIIFDPEETVTDFTLNDSFKKIHDNIFVLHSLVTDKFSILRDEFDEFVSFSKRPILPSEKILSSISFSAMGLNELVIFDTVNRNLTNICNDMNLLLQTLEVDNEYDLLENHCWQWNRLRASKPQRPNNNQKAMAWIELSNIASYPEISATTWLNAKRCCTEATVIPVCWTWDNLICGCPHGITWRQIALNDASTGYARTWNSVSANCCDTPTVFFADCISDC
jgi:hypothetical protein